MLEPAAVTVQGVAGQHAESEPDGNAARHAARRRGRRRGGPGRPLRPPQPPGAAQGGGDPSDEPQVCVRTRRDAAHGHPSASKGGASQTKRQSDLPALCFGHQL